MHSAPRSAKALDWRCAEEHYSALTVDRIPAAPVKKLLPVIAITVIAATRPSTAQDSSLRQQLEAIHNEWFVAFERGDGAAMDKLEANNLVLVFQDGQIWKKSAPRAGNAQPTGYKSRSLVDVEVCQFGDTAVLTGLLQSVNADSKPGVDGTPTMEP